MFSMFIHSCCLKGLWSTLWYHCHKRLRCSDPFEVSGSPLNGNVEDLFGILTGSTVISEILASGCNLTGTLTDRYSLRQGGVQTAAKIKNPNGTGLEGKAVRCMPNLSCASALPKLVSCSF